MFNRKKSPVTEAPLVTVQDGRIAEAWGYSLTEWAALTDAERRDCRDRVIYAPNV
jgi:hypothetical protein